MRRFALGLLLLAAVPARAITVEEIPSPRPASWAVDLTGRIPQETLRQIDSLGAEVKASSGAEVVVVIVGSTGGAESHEFATRLFNAWGIGDRTRNNGVLIFAALDDRAAEIVLGSGIDNEPSRRTSEDIMQNEMVPRFRAGDPAGAVLAGATACARRILDMPGSDAVQASPSMPEPPIVQLPTGRPPVAEPLPLESPGERPNLVARLYIALFALAALGCGLYAFLRFRFRLCPSCRDKMVRLSEAADDEHLDPAERAEEKVGSVDYDVWWCQGCGMVAKRRFGSFFTHYSNCPQCKRKTWLSTQETLRLATYDREGLVRIMESCASCSYEASYTRKTLRLVHLAANRSSFSSTSVGSSRSSSSSGFDGGSSGGGGASGRW